MKMLPPIVTITVVVVARSTLVLAAQTGVLCTRYGANTSGEHFDGGDRVSSFPRLSVSTTLMLKIKENEDCVIKSQRSPLIESSKQFLLLLVIE